MEVNAKYEKLDVVMMAQGQHRLESDQTIVRL
jgi:hypothetical protein